MSHKGHFLGYTMPEPERTLTEPWTRTKVAARLWPNHGETQTGAAEGGTPAAAPEVPQTAPAAPEVPSAPAPAVEQPSWLSVRDAAKNYGYDLSTYQDDQTALQALVQRARSAEQATELARYGQQYLQHQTQFQDYLKQRQEEEAKKAQAQPQSWWKAPEFDPRWRNMVRRDEATGNLVAAPGAPPDIVQRYLTAVDHQQQFLDKFTFDPLGAIKPGVEEVARQVAAQLIQQHLGGYASTQQAQDYVRQNAAWLFQRDPQGQPVYGQNGQPQLSPAGRLFGQYVQQAVDMGIQGESARAHYARGMVERDLLVSQERQRQEQASAAQQGEAAKQRLVQQGAAQHVPAAGGSTQARVQNTKQSLYERLKTAAAGAGLTDQTIAANGR
jgi:hypothetical protein